MPLRGAGSTPDSANVMQLYCPQCDALVEEGATRCTKCTARFDLKNGWRPSSKRGARMSWASFMAWFLFSPVVLVFVTFGLLCAWECSAGPWLTIFFAPIAVVILWLGLVIYFWRTKRTD